MAIGAGPLGEFLRARRGLVSPEMVGMIAGSARQVAGLRREEVALLSNSSTDYYVRLEQGRERHPSTQVIDALAVALQLEFGAHRYLRELAEPHVVGDAPRHASEHASRLDDLIGRWPHTPAMVLNGHLDVLARNHLADALYEGLPHRDNIARMTFYDDDIKDFVDDWDLHAQCTVATLRGAWGSSRNANSEWVSLVAELSERSGAFRRLWARHDVHRKGAATKRFRHRVAGPLMLHQHVMTVPDHPGLQIWIYQPEPGTAAETALAALSTGPRPQLRCDT